MATRFSPRLDILPPAQQRLWKELAAVPDGFVLYGGTAVALHLGHRQSIDFDFFSEDHIDPARLYRETRFLRGSRIVQQEPDTLTCLVDRDGSIKVSFFGLPNLARIRKPVAAPDTRLKIASLLDLAATKVAVVQSRAQAKDYVDIDALIEAGITLPQALAAARLAYGSAYEPLPTLKALTYFEDGDLGSLPHDVRRRLVEKVRGVDPLRLPSLKRTPKQSRDRDGERSR